MKELHNSWHAFRSRGYKVFNMKNLSRISILLMSLFVVTLAHAQSGNDILTNVEAALKASSSKELSKHLHAKVEIKLDGVRKEYSINQAEIMLKDFFQDYPGEGFEFIHKGNNFSGGIRYAIGSYTSNSGKHRVVVRAKKFKDAYKIYRLEFTKD